MILRLVYPLEKPFVRIRGFEEHEIWNPGTWYGVDVAPTTRDAKGNLIAAADGVTSHWEKKSTGGGYNFRLNFTNYPSYFMWYAHNSIIPPNRKVFKQGQVIGKSGGTGGVTGPHLHFSLMQGSTPKDPDNPNVVRWITKDPMADIKQIFRHIFITVNARWPTSTEIDRFLKSSYGKSGKPYAYVQKTWLYKNWIKKSTIEFDQETIKQIEETHEKEINAQEDRIKECRDRGTELVGEIVGLKEEIKTFKEPKGPKIPRITKFDNLWDKMWKWLLQ